MLAACGRGAGVSYYKQTVRSVTARCAEAINDGVATPLDGRTGEREGRAARRWQTGLFDNGEI
jgi:hypothetical protein